MKDKPPTSHHQKQQSNGHNNNATNNNEGQNHRPPKKKKAKPSNNNKKNNEKAAKPKDHSHLNNVKAKSHHHSGPSVASTYNSGYTEGYHNHLHPSNYHLNNNHQPLKASTTNGGGGLYTNEKVLIYGENHPRKANVINGRQRHHHNFIGGAKNGEAEHQLDLRVATISSALSQQIRNGDSRHGLYGNSKREFFYDGEPIAACSKTQAILLTIFVFTSIFLTSLAAAFFRPFNADCEYDEDIIPAVEISTEEPGLLATNGETFPWDDVRLPSFIVPLRYDIELTPNLTTRWVKGIEKMIFEVTEETNFIVFHSANITITSRTLNERLQVEQMLEYPYREQIYLETDEYMVPGVSYAIRLKFQYKLSRTLEGFYLSSYKDKNGLEKFLATSHFEPTYARRAFPCFDEPQLKAKFLMTITHDKSIDAFFNAPKKNIAPVRGKPDQIRDEFQETVEMSTYLVAFVVCDFTSVNVVSERGVNISVIAAPDKIGQTNFALNVTSLMMTYYHDFFGVKYPLPKQDLIAIPDFGAGAMENWGLITYRETALLYSEPETSEDSKQWIAITVAHELAHQWFGNLVTMKWWNDLWLNEGFASWMEYKGVNHAFPEWKMMEQFYIDVTAPALALDSLTTSHPISVEVEDPKEIEAIFDTISYKKGAAIIHMLEDLVGRESWTAGLKRYLNKYKFKNANTADLWDCISDVWQDGAYGFSVRQMMDTWTLQTGYPIVTFERINDTDIYLVKQERYLKALSLNVTDLDQEDELEDRIENEKHVYQWIVPVSYMTSVDGFPVHKIVLNETSVDAEDAEDSGSNRFVGVEIEIPSHAIWFKANINGTGFYRVNYPLANWDALIVELERDHQVFSGADRAQLINDAFSLVQANLLPAEKPLEMCDYLIKETEFVPWSVALKQLLSMRTSLQETDLLPLCNGFIEHLIMPMYNKVGWNDEGDHMEKMLRKLILETAVDIEIPSAVDKAVAMFNEFMEDETKNPIKPNLKWVVYRAGVRYGGKEEWKFAWTKYYNSTVPSEKSLWMRALAESQESYILQQYLDATLDRKKVRPQDVTTIMSGVARNPSGAQLAWRHVRMHWDTYLEKFGLGSFLMGAIIECTTSHFSTEFDYKQVKKFFRGRRNHIGSGVRALDQSLEQMLVNIEWRENHENKIREWIIGKIGRTDHLIPDN